MHNNMIALTTHRPTMRYGRLSVLCVLTAVTLHGLAIPLAPHWDHISVKHTWNHVPENWESLGPPPAGTTIDLNILLMPQDENALIDALYKVSDPSSPTHVLLFKLFRVRYTHMRPCSVTDMENTYQRSRSLSLSALTKTRSSSYTLGLETITYRPPPSQ